MKTRRNFLYTVMMGCLLWATSVSPVGAAGENGNLLLNGSFEQAGAQPDLAANWLRWGDWINREDSWTPTHDGKCLIGYHHWQIEKSDDSGLWQDVQVESGKTYEFSVFVQHDNPGTASGADNVQIALESADSDPPKTINLLKTKVEQLATGTNWSHLKVQGTATSASLRVLIRLVPSKDRPRGGALKIDDASLVLVQH